LATHCGQAAETLGRALSARPHLSDDPRAAGHRTPARRRVDAPAGGR
jgi:hypothetical protein